jgi:hypothetical protein
MGRVAVGASSLTVCFSMACSSSAGLDPAAECEADFPTAASLACRANGGSACEDGVLSEEAILCIAQSLGNERSDEATAGNRGGYDVGTLLAEEKPNKDAPMAKSTRAKLDSLSEMGEMDSL